MPEPKNLIPKEALPSPLEEDECIELIRWRDDWHTGRLIPNVDLLIHIPQGGHRSKAEGAKFKAMGVRAGVVDYCLPVAVGNYHGLWFDMKRRDWRGKLPPFQYLWLQAMKRQGYATAVCRGADEAKTLVRLYLQTGYVPEEVASWEQS